MVCNLSLKNFSSDISSFWFYGDLLALIDNVDLEGNWVANNYINLRSSEKNRPFRLFFYNNNYRDKMVEYYNCPYIDFQKISKNNPILKGIKISDYVREQVLSGKCVFLMVERNCFSRYKNKKLRSHQIMIYGLSSQKEKFIYCDNDINGVYKTNLTCSFDDLDKGYEKFSLAPDPNEPDFSSSIFLVNPKEDKNYSININDIKASIEEFLLLRTDYKYKQEGEKFKFGVEVYKHFSEYFYTILDNSKMLEKDIRCFHLLWDHKRVMVKRIQLIEKELKFNDELSKAYINIEKSFLIIRNLMLKLFIKFEEDTLIRIIKKFKYATKLEEEILTNLVNKMKLPVLSFH